MDRLESFAPHFYLAARAKDKGGHVCTVTSQDASPLLMTLRQEPVLREHAVLSTQRFSSSVHTRPYYPVNSRLLPSSQLDDMLLSWKKSADILGEINAMVRSDSMKHDSFRHHVERASTFASIRHVPTSWGLRSGRRTSPTLLEIRDVGGVSPFPDVESAVDARRFLRYTEFLTRVALD
jgi:hypothetical protein